MSARVPNSRAYWDLRAETVKDSLLHREPVSAGIGEVIGNSGWVLTYVTDSDAVISRSSQSQTLSVGGVL